MTISEVWELYQRDKSQQIIDWRRQAQARSRLSSLDKLPAGSVILQEVQKLTALLARSYALGTIRHDLGTLHAALSHAHQCGKIAGVPHIPKPEDDRKPRTPLSWEEMERLINFSSAFPIYVRTFVRLIVYTAQRKEAALSLKWGQVDMRRGVIDFDADRQTREKHRAIVPIHKSLDAYLKFMRPAQTMQGDNAYVVQQKNGLRIQRVDAQFAKLTAKAGFKKGEAFPHLMRHSVASELVSDGVSLEQVSRLLGHADIKTTQRTYVHYQPEFMGPAVDSIPF